MTSTGPDSIHDVTVCICTYRRPSLAETLASVAAQHGVDAATLAVVVVDNDGDRRARERILATAANVGLAVRYVHAPARNISVARNAALDAVATRWAALIDDDEVASPTWLGELMAMRDGVAAVIGQVQAIYAPDAPSWLRRADFHSHRITGRIDNAYTSNALLDMMFVRAAGLRFRPELGETGGEDTLFFRELTAAGGRMVYAPRALVDEAVAPARATMRWVLRRRFRTGQTHALMIRDLDPGAFGTLAIVASAKAVWSAMMSIATVPGTTASRRWIARAALHAGAVAEALGKP